MNLTILWVLVSGFVISGGDGLDRPISWTCNDQVIGDMVRLVAEAEKKRFVVTAESASKMVLPAPCLAGGAVSAGCSIRVLKVFGGLKVWMADEVMVWFDSNSIPGLLDNDLVKDPGSETEECLWLDAVADLDLQNASIDTFAEEFSSAFGVRCVYGKECVSASKTVTLMAEGIDAGTVLAIACESLGVRYQRFPGWLRLTAEVGGELESRRSKDTGSAELLGDCSLSERFSVRSSLEKEGTSGIYEQDGVVIAVDRYNQKTGDVMVETGIRLSYINEVQRLAEGVVQ